MTSADTNIHNSSATPPPIPLIPSSSAPIELSPIAAAARGLEITGLDILRQTPDDVVDMSRVEELMTQMYADAVTGGTDLIYGPHEAVHLRLWKPTNTNTTSNSNSNSNSSSNPSKAPMILFVHGGSWRSGTYLDSVGSKKVAHLTAKGYAFVSVNYRLIPSVTIEEQVQDVADSLKYLIDHALEHGLDAPRVVLMGHSSGAHVVTLLGTDTSYLSRAGLSISIVKGVIALDGSNYNAFAEITDSPGPVADNLVLGMGRDPVRLRALSPTYHARAPNAAAFLLLHVQRRGDVRQAVELAASLEAAGTVVEVRVFEGSHFGGHMQMLLRLGKREYPATVVVDEWLERYLEVRCDSCIHPS